MEIAEHTVKWRRGKDGYAKSRCGRFEIKPVWNGCTRPQSFILNDTNNNELYGKLRSHGAAKERAQNIVDSEL